MNDRSPEAGVVPNEKKASEVAMSEGGASSSTITVKSPDHMSLSLVQLTFIGAVVLVGLNLALLLVDRWTLRAGGGDDGLIGAVIFMVFVNIILGPALLILSMVAMLVALKKSRRQDFYFGLGSFAVISLAFFFISRLAT